MVSLALQQNGYALENASEELRNDIQVVLLAIQQDREAFRDSSKEL